MPPELYSWHWRRVSGNNGNNNDNDSNSSNDSSSNNSSNHPGPVVWHPLYGQIELWSKREQAISVIREESPTHHYNEWNQTKWTDTPRFGLLRFNISRSFFVVEGVSRGTVVVVDVVVVDVVVVGDGGG